MSMKRALFVAGGWPGHEPQACADRFAARLHEQGFAAEIADSLDVLLDAGRLRDLDLIVPVWSMGALTAEQERGLLTAARNGTGVAGWHGGMADAFRASPANQFMVGGQWVAHPGDVIDYTVQVADHSHPITHGSPTSPCARSSTTCMWTPRTRSWRPRLSAAQRATRPGSQAASCRWSGRADGAPGG